MAEADARIVALVGSTTTMFVITNEQPFGRFVSASPASRRAENLRREGQSIEIVGEDELRMRLGP